MKRCRRAEDSPPASVRMPEGCAAVANTLRRTVPRNVSSDYLRSSGVAVERLETKSPAGAGQGASISVEDLNDRTPADDQPIDEQQDDRADNRADPPRRLFLTSEQRRGQNPADE